MSLDAWYDNASEVVFYFPQIFVTGTLANDDESFVLLVLGKISFLLMSVALPWPSVNFIVASLALAAGTHHPHPYPPSRNPVVCYP